MYKIEEKLKEIITPLLEFNDAFLVDLKIGKLKHSTQIHVYIDKDTFITIDDCYNIARQIEKKMSEMELWNDSINLEVSSPGSEKPLKFLRQYKKLTGKSFNIKYKKEEKTISAKLTLEKIENEELFFKEDGLKLNFDEIIESKVIFSFK